MDTSKDPKLTKQYIAEQLAGTKYNVRPKDNLQTHLAQYKKFLESGNAKDISGLEVLKSKISDKVENAAEEMIGAESLIKEIKRVKPQSSFTGMPKLSNNAKAPIKEEMPPERKQPDEMMSTAQLKGLEQMLKQKEQDRQLKEIMQKQEAEGIAFNEQRAKEQQDLMAEITKKEAKELDEKRKNQKGRYTLKSLQDLDELEGKALKYLARRGTKTQVLEFLNRMRIDKQRQASGKDLTDKEKMLLDKYRRDIEQFAILSDVDELVEKRKARAEVEKKLDAKAKILEGQLVKK